MKIALVILHADATRGGAERYTIDLAAALAKAGHDVSLLATSFGEVPQRVRQVELQANALTRTGRYRRMLDSLDAHLASESHDIVHAMLPVRRCDMYHPHAGLAVAAVEQKRLQAILNPRRLSMASVERELLSASRPPVVLCLSQYVRRSIVKHYPLDDDRLPIVFNAVDLARFTPRERSSSETVNALIIAQDFHRKGLSQVMKALKLLDEPRLQLTVVGGNDVPAFMLLAKLDRIEDRVKFVGTVSDSVPFYCDADFFVLPTKHDPCSLVVLEALAMGLPVISTRFNGATEIMTDGVHGFILDDPNDAEALADRMKRLADPELRARMSQACLELRPKLAYEHHLSTLLAIYSRIISARKAHV